MCNQRAIQVLCLALVLTYQFALVYVWIVFILTSAYDREGVERAGNTRSSG